MKSGASAECFSNGLATALIGVRGTFSVTTDEQVSLTQILVLPAVPLPGGYGDRGRPDPHDPKVMAGQELPAAAPAFHPPISPARMFHHSELNHHGHPVQFRFEQTPRGQEFIERRPVLSIRAPAIALRQP